MKQLEIKSSLKLTGRDNHHIRTSIINMPGVKTINDLC